MVTDVRWKLSGPRDTRGGRIGTPPCSDSGELYVSGTPESIDNFGHIKARKLYPGLFFHQLYEGAQVYL